MSSKPIRVLLIEDNPGDARLIREMLLEAGRSNFKLEWVDRLAQAIERLASGDINIVLTDLGLPDSQGLDGLMKIQEQDAGVPVVVLTGLRDEALGIEAIARGAQDYLVKGHIDGEVLVRSLSYAIEREQLSAELLEAKNYTESIIKNFLDTLIVVDTEAKIKTINPETSNLLGYTEEELVGQPISVVFAEEEEEEAKQFFQFFKHVDKSKTGEHREIRNVELTYKAKDGRRIPMSFNASVLTDGYGNITGVVAGAKDISDIRQAQEAEARAKVERIEQLERELRSLEQLSTSAQTTITAQFFGVVPLSESVPDMFNELAQRYGGLLDLALEQRAYKVKHNISGELRSIADQMGFLKTGPRDVVEIHSITMKRKGKGVTSEKFQAYVEEGRLMVLELMGYLASFYRAYSSTATAVKMNNTPVKERNDE